MENPSTLPWLKKEFMSSSNIKQSYLRNIKSELATSFSSDKKSSELNRKRKANVSTSAGPLKKRAISHDQGTEQSFTKTTKRCTNRNSDLEKVDLMKTMNVSLLGSSIARSCKSNSAFLNSHQLLLSQPSIFDLYKPCNSLLYPLQSIRQSIIHQSFHDKKLTPAFGHSKHCEPFASRVQSHLNEISKNKAESDINAEPIENTPSICKVLASTEDRDYLSEIQCLIRENVEIFTATEQDATSHSR